MATHSWIRRVFSPTPRTSRAHSGRSRNPDLVDSFASRAMEDSPMMTHTAVTDLTPIKGMSLKQIRIDYRPDREKFLRSFKGLEFINDKPVAVFWKEVEGK